MISKSKIKKTVNNQIYNKHRLHYLKWKLDKKNDWSIRYFFIFDDRPEYTHKWVLKSHQEKHYINLKATEAFAYLQKYCDDLQAEEIYGLKIPHSFQKIIIHPQLGCSCFSESVIK